MNELSFLLTEWRYKNRLTGRKAADIIGCSPEMLAQWEFKGVIPVRRAYIQKICDVLGYKNVGADPRTFSLRLRAYQKVNLLKGYEVAEEIGISPKLYQKWCSNVSRPNFEFMRAVFDRLDLFAYETNAKPKETASTRKKVTPCHFCGKIPNHIRATEDDKEWFVICDRCGNKGPKVSKMEDAVNAWNEQEGPLHVHEA